MLVRLTLLCWLLFVSNEQFGYARSFLKVGTAAREITAPAGTPFRNFPIREESGPVTGDRIATGTHDPMMAKALVMQEGEVTVALVALDLSRFKRNAIAEVRARVTRRIDIPAENIIIGATHTHNSPAIEDNERHTVDKNKVHGIYDIVADIVVEAYENLQPARIGVGRGEANLAFNRRLLTTDNRVIFLKRNTDRKYTGIVDREVGVIRIDGPSGYGLATIVNFAAHPMTLGMAFRQFSADYPGATTRHLETILHNAWGPPMRTLFFNGALGNLVPYEAETGDPATMESVGITLAEEVNRVYQNIPMSMHAGLAVMHRTLTYENQQTTGQMETIDIDAIFLNNTVLVTAPGELFVELGLEFKRRSPYLHSFVLGLTGGRVDYIANEAAYQFGGYGANTQVSVPHDLGTRIVQTWLDMAYEHLGEPIVQY